MNTENTENTENTKQQQLEDSLSTREKVTKYSLKKKIRCNGVKPSKSDVYTLAAELQSKYNLYYFHTAVIAALGSYDYHYHYHNHYHYHYHYHYDHYNDYYQYYYHFSKQEKTIALLFLAAMYST